MSTPITPYVKDALIFLLQDPVEGFNILMTTVAPKYGIQPVSIDWTFPGSKQFFPCDVTPDEVQASSPFKYPMAMLYGMSSDNTHESMGRNFSGPILLGLDFWLTSKATNLVKAGMTLENTCGALEEVCNQMLYNGNWPQLYGATNAVCLPPKFSRGRIEKGGEEWRQRCSMTMNFTADMN